MSFQHVRKGHQLYVLYKDGEPRMEMGTVVSASAPVTKYPSQQMAFNPQQPYLPELVMDLSVDCGGNTYNFPQIPANRDIIDYGNGNVVLSCTKESMSAEIESMVQRSQDVIKSVEYHQCVVEKCSAIIEQLNPERAERKRQEAENQELKKELAEVKQMLAQFMSRAPTGAEKTQKNK